MNKTLVASLDEAQGAELGDQLGVDRGWAEKSKSASVKGEGSDAKRARLA